MSKNDGKKNKQNKGKRGKRVIACPKCLGQLRDCYCFPAPRGIIIRYID